MKKHIFLLAISLLIALCFMTACGSIDSVSNEEAKVGETGTSDNDSEETNDPTSGTIHETPVPDDAARKLIETVTINAQTKTFDNFISDVQSKTVELGGYIQTSTLSGESGMNRYRYSSMTLRIPADKSGGFIDAISESATIVYKESNLSDVTLSYADTQAHIKALRTEQGSLLKLLENAQSVSDIITVRDQLTDVEYKIESYESQLRMYDNRIAFSTINLSVNEVEKEMQTDGLSFWQQIGGNLSDALTNIGVFCRGALIFIVSALPYMILIGIFVYIVLLFALILPRRRGRKNAEKQNLSVDDKNR